MSRVVVNEIQAKVGNDISFNDAAKIDTLKGKTTAGSISIQGEGSNTTNLQQGLAKQWIHFNGSGTIAILDSFNTTTIVDNGSGDYQVTIANDMSNVNYSVSGTMCYPTTGNSSAARQGPAVNEHAVGSYQVYCGSNTTTLDDVAVINLQTMGDLA
tara:strand:- start:2421 stop:2888 length:468 start_codon:yes stop_codon:yes gene_type:complete